MVKDKDSNHEVSVKEFVSAVSRESLFANEEEENGTDEDEKETVCKNRDGSFDDSNDVMAAAGRYDRN